MRSKATTAGVLAAIVCSLAGPAPAAAAEGSYGNSLSQVYSAHQRILALREACNQALPAQAKTHDKAYAAWQGRHQALLAELEGRLTQMIRGASKDERDYMRNVGKYEGAIFEERQNYRAQFLLLPRAEVERLCREFPQYLAGPEADLAREYADELRVLRQRKPPQ